MVFQMNRKKGKTQNFCCRKRDRGRDTRRGSQSNVEKGQMLDSLRQEVWWWVVDRSICPLSQPHAHAWHGWSFYSKCMFLVKQLRQPILWWLNTALLTAAVKSPSNLLSTHARTHAGTHAHTLHYDNQVDMCRLKPSFWVFPCSCVLIDQWLSRIGGDGKRLK